MRKKFLSKAMKISKRKKKRGHGSSDSSEGRSSTSSSSTSNAAGGSNLGRKRLFQEELKVHSIAEDYPGVLTTNWLMTCQDQMLNSQGQPWNTERETVPAIALLFYRNHAQNRFSPAMSREYGTMCMILDLLLQARPAEACDAIVQRLKSLEGIAAGMHYSVSQRMELLALDKGMTATAVEANDAARLAREEERALSRGGKAQGRTTDNPPSGGGYKGNKGKGPGKKGKGGKEGKNAQEAADKRKKE